MFGELSGRITSGLLRLRQAPAPRRLRNLLVRRSWRRVQTPGSRCQCFFSWALRTATGSHSVNKTLAADDTDDTDYADSFLNLRNLRLMISRHTKSSASPRIRHTLAAKVISKPL